MVKVTLKDGTVVEGTSEEIYALDLFVETDEVVSVEEVEEASLKAGDYIRVINVDKIMYGYKHYENGGVYEIKKIDEDGDPVPYNKNGGRGTYIRKSEMHAIERISHEEVASAKAQAEADAEQRKRDAVFTANGRKVNEYREGDIVKITLKEGVSCEYVGEVEDLDADSIGVQINYRGNYDYIGAYFDEGDKAEPVVFVESRLDRN